jgi:outer membrane protein
MKKIILLIFAIFLCQFTFAQSVWNLQKCVQYAIENNLQLKQSIVNTKLTQVNYNQAKLAFIPTLTGDVTQYFNFGRSLNVTSNSYESSKSVSSNTFSLNSSMPIFAGLTKQNQLKQNQLDMQASQFDAEKIKNDIALNIAAYFLSSLNAWEQLKIMQRQIEVTNLQIQQTERLIKAGSLAEISIKDVEATLANDKMNIVTAQNNYDLAILNLKRLMNIDVSQSLMIDTTLQNLTIAEADLDFNRTYSLAYDLQPSIKSQQLKFKSAKQNIQYYKGTLYPTLSLFGSLRTSYSSAAKNIIGLDPNGNFITEKIKFESQIDKNYGKSVGLDLSIPINNGFQARTALRRSKLQAINSKLNLEISEKQLQQDIAQALLNVKAAAAKQEAAKALALAQESAFEANTKKYNAGVINYLDFNTSKNNLTKALSDLSNAKYDYVFKIKILDFYQGKSLY